MYFIVYLIATTINITQNEMIITGNYCTASECRRQLCFLCGDRLGLGRNTFV